MGSSCDKPFLRNKDVFDKFDTVKKFKTNRFFFFFFCLSPKGCCFYWHYLLTKDLPSQEREKYSNGISGFSDTRRKPSREPCIHTVIVKLLQCVLLELQREFFFKFSEALLICRKIWLVEFWWTYKHESEVFPLLGFATLFLLFIITVPML